MRKSILLIIILAGLFSINLSGASNTVQSPNAAIYYKHAFEQMKYPESEELNSLISDVIAEGWHRENTELEGVLNDNEACLHAFKSGAALSNCEFRIGKRSKYLMEEEFPHPVTALNLSYLALLKARYLESEGDIDSAIKIYLSVLKYAQHMAFDNLMGSKAVALAAEKFCFNPLKLLVAEKKIGRRQLSEIRFFLEDYEPRRPTKVSILVAVREEQKSVYQMIGDVFVISLTDIYHQNPGRLPDDTLSRAALFRRDFVRFFIEELNLLYGNYIRALETNNPQDWDYAHTASAKRKSAAEKMRIQNPEFGSETVSKCFEAYKEHRSTGCIEDLVTFMIAGNVPIPMKLFENMDASLLEIRAINDLMVERLTH